MKSSKDDVDGTSSVVTENEPHKGSVYRCLVLSELTRKILFHYSIVKGRILLGFQRIVWIFF